MGNILRPRYHVNGPPFFQILEIIDLFRIPAPEPISKLISAPKRTNRGHTPYDCIR